MKIINAFMFVVLTLIVMQDIKAVDCDNIMEEDQCLMPVLPTIHIDASYSSGFDPSFYSDYNYTDSYFGGSGNTVQLPSINIQAIDEDKKDNDCNKTTNNPIVISNGEKTQKEIDFFNLGENPLEFARYYNSFQKGSADFSASGKWRHSFDYHLIQDDNQRLIRQLPNGENIFINDLDAANFVDNKWIVKLSGGGIEVYDSDGYILSKKNINGIGWDLKYNYGNVIEVNHTNGTKIILEWISGKLTKVKDSIGNIYTYAYNNNRLNSVIYPNNTGVRLYHYGENGADPNYLTGISVNGKRFSTYLYNGSKAIQSGRADGTQVDKVSYGDNYSIFTNPLGAISKYIYTDTKKDKLTRIERSGIGSCPNSSAVTSYDSNGFINSKIDWNGIETKYQRDSYGRVLQETNGIKNGNYSNTNIIKYTWKTSPSIILKKEYFNNSNTLVKDISYEYYPDNNRIKSIKTCSKVSTNLCDTIGYGYTFHSNGIPKDIAVNRNGKTSIYSYDSLSNLIQVKNALGHIITLSNYDGLGHVGKVVDANGFTTEYIYDVRGRIITKKETLGTNQVRTITYTYGAFGITQVESNEMRETINYSDNGTIASITHGVGTQINSQQIFIYSKLGVLLNVEYREGANVKYAYTNNHNQLGWTTADVGNNSQNIRYQYDGNGNITQKTDSLGNITTYTYNVRGQIEQEKQYDGSINTYSYDSQGNLTAIKDSKGNTTAYTYDGFGRILSQSSPDSGLSKYEYDVDGNLTKLTRANNVVTTYSYDVLNRRIKVQTGTQIQTWVYDNCTNGKGRLCGTADGISSTGYGYTVDGQLSIQVKKINGTEYQTLWTYDQYGRLISESRPNDAYKISYEYDAFSRVSAVKVKIGATTQSVVSNITYEPYGAAKSWTFGNGLTRQVTYDKDYRLTGIQTPNIQNLSHQYNANNSINGISNIFDSKYSTSYSYDTLGQLTRSASQQYSENWMVDSNGNRVSRVGNTNATTNYSITTGNRLTATTGAEAKTFSYDALGNITKKSGYGGTLEYSYDGFNRLKTAKAGTTTYTYDYGTDNLRTRKSDGTSNIHYIYAPDGRLLAESPAAVGQTGNLKNIYIWLAGKPIGLIRDNQLYYVHTDHLGRPELLTNSVKAIVWKSQPASYDSAPIQSSIGDFNLGFPGQYYDVESNLWYNWNRYYDATLGRYTQADPIGLAGGLNSYTYVGNNPVNFIDPYGLWSLSIEGYYGVGGGASISYNNGTLEVLGKVGVGLGAGVGLDPNGKPSKHALECGSGAIARTNSKLEMGAGIGPIEATLFGISGYTGNGLVQSEKGGDFQFNKPQLVIPGVTVDPSKKFSWRIGGSVGGNVSAEFGHYSNW
ncbi:RHS repeat-associated core domain-containing protein [Acinetobacter pittii]|uniref:RHS repeat-associated core domain-containing protein n=1 Tax=Acinetobacter pittii TaxID=48296 RepID=UPI002A08F65D|nr:RHS repeat-associated core domain-containing protein [Acinetobacter pittii]MDX8255119.1 RHS repeat-associated core domain-containing protein [Acinetobacter pittii]